MSPAPSRAHGPAEIGQRTPTLFQDLGTVARLYGTVFWMIGQRLQRGPEWDHKLTEEALRTREERERLAECRTGAAP